MQRIKRVGPVVQGECRTIEKQGADVELIDTVPVRLSMWKAVNGAQRWICCELVDRRLEVFIPVDFFEPNQKLLEGVHRGDVLLES